MFFGLTPLKNLFLKFSLWVPAGILVVGWTLMATAVSTTGMVVLSGYKKLAKPVAPKTNIY